MLTKTPPAHGASLRSAPMAIDTGTGRGDLGHTIQLMGATMSYLRNAEIYGENEPAEYVYMVVTGAVRTYRVMNDGRRQIGGFFLAGDIFGIEAGGTHHFSAEAIKDSTVLVVKRSVLVTLASQDGSIAHQLWTFTARELERVQGHLLLLIKSAQERVASFLIEMSRRLASVDYIELPMSRQDIADYLGLTIETVSRTMTQLETEAAIALPSSRRIVLRDRKALDRLNS